jgi:hypothetical protein
MDRNPEQALLELRDAVDSYLAYRDQVPDDEDAAALADAALGNIVDRIRSCQRAGSDGEQIGSVITPVME